MQDEQKDISWVSQQVHSEQEVPFLYPEWLNVLNSDYIDAYAEALDVLEGVPWVNAAEVHKRIYPGYID